MTNKCNMKTCRLVKGIKLKRPNRIQGGTLYMEYVKCSVCDVYFPIKNISSRVFCNCCGARYKTKSTTHNKLKHLIKVKRY